MALEMDSMCVGHKLARQLRKSRLVYHSPEPSSPMSFTRDTSNEIDEWVLQNCQNSASLYISQKRIFRCIRFESKGSVDRRCMRSAVIQTSVPSVHCLHWLFAETFATYSAFLRPCQLDCIEKSSSKWCSFINIEGHIYLFDMFKIVYKWDPLLRVWRDDKSVTIAEIISKFQRQRSVASNH